MSAATAIAARLEDGRPLRVGELARLIGYHRNQVRKWLDNGHLRFVRATVPSAERRIPVEEAERLARDLALIPS